MIDHWIHSEVCLPELWLSQGEENKTDKIIGRSKDNDGKTIDTYDNNQFNNTLVYDIRFLNGEIKEYDDNVIAKNIYAQVDSDCFSRSIIDSITDYRKDDTAAKRDNMHITTTSCQKILRQIHLAGSSYTNL